MNVSQKNAMLAMGSNLTISCSDKRPFDMDWLLGRSHLSSCTLRTDHSRCLPGGRFVVRPDNDTFQLNLVNLALQDCGTYTCKTSSSQKTHTVRLIERVKMAELSETDDAITLTTGCVLPGYTVDIRWFYVHKDEPPHLYDKPTFRLERTEGCSGVCVDNNLVRVSSTLQLPTTLKQPLSVKLMATIQQDGHLWQYTTARDYAIEGCPPETAETVIKWLLVMVCIFCSLHLVSVIHSVCKSKTARDLSRMQRAFISAVSIVCGIAGIFLQKVIRLPGACDSSNSAAHLVAVVGYVIIAVSTVAIEVLSIWREITRAGSGTGNQHMTTAEIKMKPVKPKQSKEEKKLLGSKKTSDLTVASSYDNQWKKECDLNLYGSVCKSSANKVEVDVGERAVLECKPNMTKDYPSWQKPNKELISSGGKKKFQQTDGRLAWENDKKSISIRNVQLSDAGTYTYNLNEGEVQTVDLIVKLPKKTLTVPAKSSFILDVDNRILGPYPQWSRRCIINSSFHDIFNKTEFDWDKNRKSLIVKDFRAKDEGLYEVSSNYCVQKFELRVATEDKVSLSDVEAGMNVRLECPDQGELFPSWHCVKYNIFNEAGSQKFLAPKSPTPNLVRRLEWSTDKRSLLIRDFRPDDSGTFLCRMADGTCLTFGLSFKETQKTESDEKKQETV